MNASKNKCLWETSTFLTKVSKFHPSLTFLFCDADISDNHSLQLCTLLKTHAASGVTNLDLSGNKLTDNGIVNILKAMCETRIERLVISNNKLTEKCTEQMTGILARAKHLKTLMMQDNAITNRVAKNKLINSLKKIDVVI